MSPLIDRGSVLRDENHVKQAHRNLNEQSEQMSVSSSSAVFSVQVFGTSTRADDGCNDF